MSKISLIAMDIGGTLLCDDNTITPENIEAIHYAKSKGIKIVLATAREYSSTQYISKVILADYGVFSNGSHLLDIMNLHTLKNSLIEKKAVFEILSYCKENDLYTHLNQEFCEVSDQMDYFALKHHLLNEGYPEGLKSSCYVVEDLVEYLKQDQTVTKIVIVSDNHLESHIENMQGIMQQNGLFLSEYNKDLNEHILNKKINYIELSAKQDTKATGLIELGNILGIPKEEILVFGDGDNDIEMISEFPNSVCMENGKVHIKKMAKYITTKSNNNSGVAEGIYEFVK